MKITFVQLEEFIGYDVYLKLYQPYIRDEWVHLVGIHTLNNPHTVNGYTYKYIEGNKIIKMQHLFPADGQFELLGFREHTKPKNKFKDLSDKYTELQSRGKKKKALELINNYSNLPKEDKEALIGDLDALIKFLNKRK